MEKKVLMKKIIYLIKHSPYADEYKKKENNSGAFPNEINILKIYKKKDIKKENNVQIYPSNKNCNYNISSHILNESLHIPNSENAD